MHERTNSIHEAALSWAGIYSDDFLACNDRGGLQRLLAAGLRNYAWIEDRQAVLVYIYLPMQLGRI